MIMSACAGLRTIELQFLLRSHVNIERGEIRIVMVKGQGSYGEPRTAPVQPGGLPILERYLKVRDELMLTTGGSPYMFPSVFHAKHLSGNTMRKFKDAVAAELDIDIDYRAGRRTYGQWLIDDGVPVETVSIHMGHRTSKTTETFYARQREEDALAMTRKIWEEKRRVKG
jgi:integrase